jgi:DNA-binding transcriptional ArsR family regulator
MSCQQNRPQVEVRVAALRQLIELLRGGEMRAADLRQSLCVSPSGLRNYISILTGASIIELARREPTKFGDVGRPVYRLVAGAERIEQFLTAGTAAVSGKPARDAALPGRLIHLMDAAHGGQLGVVLTVMRDPLALPAAFFQQVRPAQAAA